jgi:hypothetical protein
MSQDQFDYEVSREEYETTFVNPPIPTRKFDWCVTRNGAEPGDPIGYGETPEEALADLQEQEEGWFEHRERKHMDRQEQQQEMERDE